MKPRRSPDIQWREEPRNREEALKTMREGGAFANLGVMTLAAEDEISQLNFVGAEIWRMCDGEHDLEAIVAHLKQVFDVPEERLQRDVEAFVGGLSTKGWLLEG